MLFAAAEFFVNLDGMSPLCWSQELYRRAWRFAASAHLGQTYPGSELPYLVHIGEVAMEMVATLAVESVDTPDLAVQCALLHDTLEDTKVSYEDLRDEFGAQVADGVLALSKDALLPGKEAQMRDSLARIRVQPREVWMVKLADRVCNLGPPPHYWNADKIRAYREEAELIYTELGGASHYLAGRLRARIEAYQTYL